MLTHSPPCPSPPLLALPVAHPRSQLAYSVSHPPIRNFPPSLKCCTICVRSSTHLLLPSLTHPLIHLPIHLLPHPLIHNSPPLPQVLAGMSKIIRECWHQNPNVRLTALRVKKSLMKLAQEDTKNKVDIDY